MIQMRAFLLATLSLLLVVNPIIQAAPSNDGIQAQNANNSTHSSSKIPDNLRQKRQSYGRGRYEDDDSAAAITIPFSGGDKLADHDKQQLQNSTAVNPQVQRVARDTTTNSTATGGSKHRRQASTAATTPSTTSPTAGTKQKRQASTAATTPSTSSSTGGSKHRRQASTPATSNSSTSTTVAPNSRKRRQNDEDSDEDASISAIPRSDKKLASDNQEQNKTSADTKIPRVARCAGDNSTVAVKQKRDTTTSNSSTHALHRREANYDDEVSNEDKTTNTNDTPVEEKPHVDVVFVPIIIREKQIIIIEEEKTEQPTTPEYYDDVTSTTSTETDKVKLSIDSVTSHPSNDLANPDEDWTITDNKKVEKPSIKIDVLPQANRDIEEKRRKRDTVPHPHKPPVLQDSNDDNSNSNETIDIVDFAVAIFAPGPVLLTNATDNSNSTNTRNKRYANFGSSSGATSGAANQPIRPKPAANPRPTSNVRPTSRTTSRPVASRPAPRPAPTSSNSRPAVGGNSRPAPIPPNRGKRNSPQYGGPQGSYGRGGGGRGGGNNQSNSQANANVQANSGSKGGGRGGSGASASASASASSSTSGGSRKG